MIDAVPVVEGDWAYRGLRFTVGLLATAIFRFHAQLVSNHQHRQEVIGMRAAGLLELSGVGPVSRDPGARLLFAPRRARLEAFFAALAGLSPIPASSSNKTPQRLNRYGDRQLNKAIHAIARSRLAPGHEAIAYIERGTAEGKTLRGSSDASNDSSPANSSGSCRPCGVIHGKGHDARRFQGPRADAGRFADGGPNYLRAAASPGG